MARILLLIFILGLVGCASTGGHRKTLQPGAASKNACTDEMQGSNVYGAIKCLLQKGTTVNVMVDYQSAYDGLPEGYEPADFGCEADSETIIETEKIFLLDSFSKYQNFSVIDRSRMNTSFAEMKLGMSDVTASNMRPGGFSSVSHLIVIEGKNHFYHLNAKNRDRYTEIKKLLDIQKDVVIAMDKLSEVRDVEYRRRHSASITTAIQPHEASHVEAAPELQPLQHLPPRVDVTPAPAPAPSEKVETLTIYGNHMQADSGPHQETYQKLEPKNEAVISGQELPPQTVYVQTLKPARKIHDWQLARVVKQRFPEMKNKDDGTVIKNFIQKHPEYKERIIMTPERKNPLGM